jgi:HAD superfamily hydrolase (TIGR01509 family)
MLINWMPPTRAVLLDVGDTLVHWGVPKPERLAWVCAQAGFALPADPDLIRRAAIAGEQHLTAAFGRFSLASEDDWRGFYQVVLAVLGCPSSAADALARHHLSLRAPWSVDPDAVLVLRELRQRGYRIGLVSVWDGTLATLCRTWAFTDLVNVIADSSVVGYHKPNPAHFRHALDALQVKPEHALHVGDTYDADVLGAEAAGIRPVLLDPLGHERRPCADRITSLPALLDLCPTLP